MWSRRYQVATRDMKGLTPPPKLKPWKAGSIARRAEPAEPHPRAEDLRERAGPDHPPAAVQRVHGRLRLPLEPELAVRVVFEDEGVVLLGEPDQLRAATERQIGARRVLEVDDRVDQLAPTALPSEPLESLAHHARDQAVGVHGHVQNLWAVPPDVVERPGERRRLADDRVARVHEGAEREREGVAGAGSDEEVLRRHLEALEHPALVA